MDVLSSISFGQRKALLYNRAFQGCRDFELLSVNKQGVPTGVGAGRSTYENLFDTKYI
jgi:hypothetical protein